MESPPAENSDPRSIDQTSQQESLAPCDSETKRKIFFETESLAEVYARQGHISVALEIYRRIQKRDPSDERICDRISRLEARLSARRGSRPREKS